jgi:hypothetical protein
MMAVGFEGSFATAIESSPFYGVDTPIVGVASGSTNAFVSGVDSDSGWSSPIRASWKIA